MNPLVWVTVETHNDVPQGRGLWIWCPGCKQVHRPRAANEDGSGFGTLWEWNGATDETFTISPSLLVYTSVHLCEGEHPPVICSNPDECGSPGHLILNDDGTQHVLGEPEPKQRVLGHGTPHTRDPAFGQCHSFIKNGQWQFLSDCAHELAGQTVPMVPLPDWLCRG